MDLVCTRCGEPWHVDHVLHDEPEGFERKDGVIFHCPVCPRETPIHSDEEEARLETIRVLGEVLGDDIDALAATLEDFDLL